MVAAGINHFANPDFYLKIVPSFLPMPSLLVYGSGVAEVVGGLGTMHPRTRRVAGWFLIATLGAVFPANVYMAVNPERFAFIPPWALIARLPLQTLFIFWVWLAALKESNGRREE